MKKLSKNVTAKLEEASSSLDEAIQEARAYADEKSDRWRESEAGTAYEAWIEELERLVGDIENLPHQPE